MTAVSDETGRDAYLPFDAPLWQQYEHRIKWLMARIGMPDSVSLAEAMKQLLNDAEYIRTNRTPAAALSAAPVAQEPAWRYEIQHGPDGETDWAWVYDAENNLVCTAKTYHAAAIVRASSPPATSAGVGADEIARAIKEAIECITDLGSGKGGWAWEEVVQRLALLSRGSGSDQAKPQQDGSL